LKPPVSLLTIGDLFAGKEPNIHLIDPTFFKKAVAEPVVA
jgi:hypothetical protein